MVWGDSTDVWAKTKKLCCRGRLTQMARQTATRCLGTNAGNGASVSLLVETSVRSPRKSSISII